MRYFKKDGTEVRFGDKLKGTITPNITLDIILTQDNVGTFIEAGVLVSVEEKAFSPKEVIKFVENELNFVDISNNLKYLHNKYSTDPKNYIATSLKKAVRNVLKHYNEAYGPWEVDSENIEFFATLLVAINPELLRTMILREVALRLDLRYKDHVKGSPNLYYIDPISDKIYNINTLRIGKEVLLKHYAVFRTISEAKFAVKILCNTDEYIQKIGKQKN